MDIEFGLFFLAFIVGPAVVGMVWQWRARERSIRHALEKRNNPRRVEALLPLLDRCVDILIAEYGADTFAHPQLTVVPGVIANRRDFIQHLITLAAERWQITPPPVNLSVVPPKDREHAAGTFVQTTADWSFNVDSDGTIGPSDEPAWRICIDPAHFHDDLAVAAIVAHEFAHGVLTRDAVALASDGENEVLTDVAAALSGFGQLMLQMQNRVERQYVANGGLSYTVGGPGYLWPQELAHVLWRHGRLSTNGAA